MLLGNFFEVDNWRHYLGLVVALFVFQIICRIIYRLTFHPLAKYPGPFLAKITNFYSFYQAWHGQLHLDVTRCHEKYGTFVRYGPDRLVVNSTRGLHDIFGYKKNVVKSKSYLPMVPEEGAWSTLTIIDKEVHRQRRKVISKALSDSALRDFEPKMVEYMAVFRDQLCGPLDSKGWSNAQDISVLCMRLTLDILGEFAFGQKLSFQTDRSQDFVSETIKLYSWRMGIYEQYPKLTKLKIDDFISLLGFGAKLRAKFEGWRDNFANMVLNGKEKGQFHLLREFKDPNGKCLPDVELLAEGSFLILAGSETTAVAMSGLFHYLAYDSKIYSRLAHEIRSTFSNLSEIVPGERLQSCAYLSACIWEALRICPPVPGIPWREVEEGGIIVDGEYIPGGYDVGTSIYAIQHDPSSFPSPYTFNPERWLKADSPEEAKSAANAALNPFSIGPRRCAGRSMALLELRLLMARTLFGFDFRLTEGEKSRAESNRGDRENEFRLYSHVTSYCEGPLLEFNAR